MLLQLLNQAMTSGTLAKVIIIVLLLAFVFVLLAKYSQVPRMIVNKGLREVVQLQIKYNRQEWEVEQGNNFTVYYSPQNEDKVALVLAASEEAYEAVNEALDFNHDAEIPVVIYPDRQSLNESFGWDSDVSAMGVYWAGVIKILSPKVWIEEDEPEAMAKKFKHDGPLVHEYVHLVVDYKTRGNYPRWFTEGLAQYWEREITGFQFNSPEGNLDQELYPLTKMDAHFDDLDNQALAYSQSLALVEYFYLKYSQVKLDQLLTELRKGRSFDEAFLEATGQSLEMYLQMFQQWIDAEQEMIEQKAG